VFFLGGGLSCLRSLEFAFIIKGQELQEELSKDTASYIRVAKSLNFNLGE
jgi:hypothetical protein